MKKLLNILLLFFVFALTSCADDGENLNNDENSICQPLEEIFQLENNDQYKLITIPDGSSGTVENKGIMTWIVDRVTDVITDSTQNIFETISEDPEFLDILNVMVTLTIMFYALSIMLGITQASGYAALVFFIKIMLVWTFATNWDEFQYYVVELFEAFVYDSVSFAANTFHDYQGWKDVYGGGTAPNPTDPTVFSEMDKLLSVFWDFTMVKVIMTFMFTGLTGFFWGLMLLMFMILYLMAVIMAVKTYLFALIARHILYALGPIFISFALFNQTKSLFDGYIEQLINFSLQPVLLFIFLGLFHSVIAGFASNLYLEDLVQNTGPLDPKPCIKYTETNWKIGEKPLFWYKLCYDNGANCTQDSKSMPTIPIDIWVLISAVIVAYLMYSMCSWVVIVATRLSSGYVNISDIPVEGFGKLQGAAKEAIGTLSKGGKRAGP
jgi:type IV secretory pathway VirB6-like protein